MNITRILSAVILCLVLYSATMTTFFDEWKQRRKKSEENVSVPQKNFNQKLQLAAGLVFCILLLFLMVTNYKLLAILLVIPSIFVYFVVFLSSTGTVGSLAMSKGDSPLTKDENGSLILIGLYLGFVGLLRSNMLDVEYSSNVSIARCLFIALEYSIYMFLIGALLIRPLKDCALAICKFAHKIRNKYITVAKYIADKVTPRKRRLVLSQIVLLKQKKTAKWFQHLLAHSLLFTIPIDIVGYLIQYTFILTVWLPITSVLILSLMVGRYLLKIMRWITNLSTRRVTVLSFRIAILAAMLTVVFLNRYEYIKTSEATTSILEFVASVIIIPIIFEWVHAAISIDKEQ